MKKMTPDRTLRIKIFSVLLALVLCLVLGACLRLKREVPAQDGLGLQVEALKNGLACINCHDKSGSSPEPGPQCQTSALLERGAVHKLFSPPAEAAEQASGDGLLEAPGRTGNEGASHRSTMLPDQSSRVCLGCHDGLIASNCQCKKECFANCQRERAR